MAKFSPQYNPHKVTAQLRASLYVTFWVIFLVSGLPSVCSQLEKHPNLKEALDIVNIVSISLFFVLEIIIEYIMFPLSEQKRRDDFIDNSLGSKFSPSNSVDYYDNEELQAGLYKVATNLFENTFFTYSLIKELTIRKIIIPAAILLAVFVFAYYGFQKDPVSLTILQVLFSANVLGNLIKHLILLNRLAVIQDNWVTLFQNQEFKFKVNDFRAQVFRNWLQYETLLSRMQPDIPGGLFIRKNSSLTEEWVKIKTKYKIA